MSPQEKHVLSSPKRINPMELTLESVMRMGVKRCMDLARLHGIDSPQVMRTLTNYGNIIDDLANNA